ncbi:bifunctional alpha/beta hydrolase/OsmC family protein [Cocleimonas sp. KMM 6892]|uniref:bifunctional alpha/beta hydrolase/OsmC family protein n=1 Tax=unclassified Cocleimonas TaxID=2639732 RepID=UPI002DBC6607|nr:MULTISPECIES: bifunctional alpha/beta hydrolase/OsmC family protein [unclassified Cocleimonas]MEB8431094.1 bifunctional alpha/beta hydrolase/OsmC family protein [Cocleimonas sp. KMM 6892]MEC4714134.1 bifunctional alpha/beta hydrolase/OsmC family protein [Cocleimonas sp. KMM 6895]MEC4743465.1 bifunctional alpha/beta hydrolase/OsmC family protein [Cocleimonas sp. KMM 6896]
MARTKVEFKNKQGETLAGLLETPDSNQQALRYAIFAHCFTCSKDVAAASRISRSLAAKGIAVFRFDFTGLGNSDGDFANTNFSSNVDDLLAAAKMLEDEYQAPSLLIGHSLGGAAVLSAAHQLPLVKAIATIGSPATADHVQHLFLNAVPELEAKGEARVKIGVQEFNIKKQLLDDLNENASSDHIANLKRPLLIFHSPVDTIVSIDEAAKIYRAAKHPKSFISLDNADHLLSNRHDSEYVGLTLAAWASRYLEIDSAEFEASQGTAPKVEHGEVVVTEKNKKFLRGLYSDSHQFLSDEPISVGGTNQGPAPYDLLLMSLGSCTSMTIRMYANFKKLPLDDITVRLKHEKINAEDCEECEGRKGKVDRITRFISFKGDLTDEQKQKMIEIADKCPVHRTLENDPIVLTQMVED